MLKYPDAQVISLGIGDTTEPIPDVITSAMAKVMYFDKIAGQFFLQLHAVVHKCCIFYFPRNLILESVLIFLELLVVKDNFSLFILRYLSN